MKRPRMSTGAWIFTGLVTAAVVAPTAVYAAASSTVAIGNTDNSLTATVTANHQLLTVPMASPKNIVRITGSAAGGACNTVYTPPAGKAIVLLQVTYDLGTGVEGTEAYATIRNTCAGLTYDWADTIHANDAQTRTFPAGLPLTSVGFFSYLTTSHITGTGYLIPTSQLPATP